MSSKSSSGPAPFCPQRVRKVCPARHTTPASATTDSPLPKEGDPGDTKSKVRLVCVSDTHGLHDKLTDEVNKAALPDGDVLIHAGDFTRFGKLADLLRFRKWLERRAGPDKFEHILIVNGNHESNARWKTFTKRVLEHGIEIGETTIDSGSGTSSRGRGAVSLADLKHAAKDAGEDVDFDEILLQSQRANDGDHHTVGSEQKTNTNVNPNIRFLRDEHTTLKITRCDRQLRVCGTDFYWPMRRTSYQDNPFYSFLSNYVLGKRRFPLEVFDVNPGLDELFKQQDNVDILISHGPCRGRVDHVVSATKLMGCGYLTRAVEEVVRPRIVVSGHIHEAHGVEERDGIVFVNAAVCIPSGYGRLGWGAEVVEV